MIKTATRIRLALCIALIMSSLGTAMAQTDEDAIMMEKSNLCSGFMYSHSSWTNYWEGTHERDNKNLGMVSTDMYGIMENYGVSRRLNVMVGAPYVETRTSAGTMHGQKGIQDLSVWLKWMVVGKKNNKGLSVFALGGGSLPLTNYVIDYLPLSIGSGSRTLSGRLIADYECHSFYATASGTYTYRGNVTIDRTSYYTTTLELTNQVEMPDVASYAFRAGYRNNNFFAEAVLAGMNTLGGFDIRRNDMPFPSNEMNAVMLGVNGKYEIPWVPGLALTGGGNYVVQGRNVGQATTFNIGAFYVLDFSKKENKSNLSPAKGDQK